MANLLQVSERTYSYYESEERQPTLSNVEKLADYFEVNTDFLLGRTKDRQSSFSEELLTLEKDTFHKAYSDLKDEVAKAMKRSAKIGDKQADICEVIEVHGNLMELEQKLKLEFETLHQPADVEVKLRNLNTPFSFVEASVRVSWGTQHTQN